MASGRLFEFVCVLLRASGIHAAEWDPWQESRGTLDDLQRLASLDLVELGFPEPERTRVRLSLLSYCHITEMDFPYSLVANLLRLRLGKKYHVNPFRALAVPMGKKKEGPFRELRLPSPGKKIGYIKQLAQEAGLPAVGEAFEWVLDRAIRNAVYHSDYTLANGEFRLLSSSRLSKKAGHYTPVVDWQELDELFKDTSSFYSALFALYQRCLGSFGDFRNAFIPFDLHYKAILELVFDDDKCLAGFRVYWPNATRSEYARTKEGCTGVNYLFDPDGSINFMVGLYASTPGRFSPLVEMGSEPVYPEIPGTTLRPHWPEELKVYKLTEASVESASRAGTSGGLTRSAEHADDLARQPD